MDALSGHDTLGTDLLPTPEVLADDLKKILDDLGEWESHPLLGLRLLPSIRFAQVNGHPAVIGDSNVDAGQGVPSNALIPERIDDARRRIADPRKRNALKALLAFQAPSQTKTERTERAAEALGIPWETFRKEGVRRLLQELASEMFRGELAWASRQLQPSTAPPGAWSVNGWCELLEVERSLVIDEQDHRKQTWTTHLLLRCVKHDVPFLVTGQRWTGSGEDNNDKTSKEPGEVKILSGGKEGPFAPRLLLVRPEFDAELAYNLYLWDLGHPRVVGEELDHIWQQVLIDKKGTFLPYIGWATERYPSLRRLRLRVKLPAGTAQKVHAKHLAVRDGTTATSYTTRVTVPVGDPIPVKRDREGYYTYEPPKIIYGQIYELEWGQRQTKTA